MEDWVLCTTCFQLVKSAKEHYKTENHRGFTYPMDGQLKAMCVECAATFNYFSELELHTKYNKEHVNFKETSDECDVDVVFSVKKSMLPDLEKIDLFKDLKKELFTPMKTRHRGKTSGTSAGGLESTSAAAGGFASSGSSSRLKNMVEVLVARRNLQHLGLGKKDIVAIRENYVLVEDQVREDTLRIIDDHLKKSKSTKDVIEFKLTNVNSRNLKESDYEFHPLLKQVCLKKELHNCSTASQGSVAKAKRIEKVLTGIRNLVDSGKSVSLHEVYYINPELYSAHSQALSNSDITDISTMMGITIQSLNIFTSPTGIIKGPLLLIIGDTILADCRMGGLAGFKIPAEVHNVTEITLTGKVDYILLVEKEDIFEELAAEGFAERNNCILFSGKGQPSANSRLMLRMLWDKLQVPVYSLFDGNYGGALIYCTYKFGSANRAYDSLLLTIPELVWIGLFPDEVQAKYRKEMSTDDLQKLRTLMYKPYMVQFPLVREKLMRMHGLKQCCDIEMIRAKSVAIY